MTTAIHVLILEDRAEDAELMLHELHRANFDVTWERVDTEKGFLAQLETHPDIILADYALPEFDGISALHILQKRNLDIPFIIVSGTIGEEIAVAAMREGAADFLIKDRLARLGPAVERTLAEKSLRDEKAKADEALRTSEKRFRALIENSADAIALSDINGTILYASPAAGRILGVSAELLVGKSSFAGLHPDDLERAKKIFQEVREHPGMTKMSQFRLRHKDGSWHWVEGIGTNLLKEPSVRAMVANYRDVTERKRADEEIRRRADEFAALYETTLDAAAQTDLTTLLQTVTEHAARLLNAPRAVIHLYDGAREQLELVLDRTGLAPVGIRMNLGEGIAGKVALTRQPLIVDDYRTWELRLPQLEGISIAASVGCRCCSAVS